MTLAFRNRTSKLGPDIQWSDSQRKALGGLESWSNVFLTGGPGTGKSFLISKFIQAQSEKIPVLASTGAAAILVGGRTFHSFFGLGIMQGGAEAVLEKARDDKKLRRRLRKCGSIIVDEISMLSAETIDCAETIARIHLDPLKPWGGLRVIAVGDFAQLPPVVRNGPRRWAFQGEAWLRSNFQSYQLEEVQRTQDQNFARILEKARWAEMDEELEDFLADRVREAEDETPHVFPKRDQTELFNRQRLQELRGRVVEIPTRYSGAEKFIEILAREAPVPAILCLKVGALVMIRVNDPKQRFVNGTLAKVVDIQDENLIVETKNRVFELEKFSFSYLNAEGEEVAVASNFPVSLAYASTIHKIQGATMDRAHVDLFGLWEPGQAYVALSRVKSPEALSVQRWSPKAFIADPQVREFYRGLRVQ